MEMGRKLSITLLFLFFHPSLSAFTPTNSYFLNCGSTSNTLLNDNNPSREFVPDSSYLISSNSESLTNLATSSPLYITTRVLKSTSSYNFTIDTQGTHVIRLHFLPFSTQNYDLKTAHFNVTALDRILLLGNFSVTSSAAPVIKEYLLWVDSDSLKITFTPSSSPPSVAFVNAIEVFTAPNNLIDSTDRKYVTPERLQSFPNLSHQALETVYRINVGGSLITPANDTLWRTWEPDNDYLFSKGLAVEAYTSQPIRYQNGIGPTREIAPEAVYNTARKMNLNNQVDHTFNITWNFKVSPGYKYLIRMHFCDIVSNSSNDPFYFNVYVDGLYAFHDLHPSEITNQMLAAPFFQDFVADTDNSGIMNVSVGPSTLNPSNPNAILNGVEIMKVNNSFGSLNGSFNPNLAPENHGGSGVSLLVLISAIVGGFALILILAAILFLLYRRRRVKPAPKPKETLTSWSPLPTSGYGSHSRTSKFTEGITPKVNLGLHISFIDIKFATNNFDEKFVIGAGGFGKVYRGVLRDDTKVAVKRGMPQSKQGYPEFQTEIILLSRIRHRHLVSLIGYCDEQSEMILVYEYMEKGPLRNYLYGSDLPCLSWKQRLEICVGSARGLHYLHTSDAQSIIHRDVKSSNILLGEDYLPKVSDFGLSRFGPSLGETHVSTGVKGSFGYLDPEYFKTRKLTDKSDVYSFGVVMFEVLCARPVIDPLLSRDQLNLAEWALHWQRRGMLDKIIDPRITGKINANSLRKFGETAEKCVAEYGTDRPTISDVLWNLEYALHLQETELRREPYEDSGNIESQIPEIALRRAPSSTTRINEEDDVSGKRDGRSDVTTSTVFSQLISDDGR